MGEDMDRSIAIILLLAIFFLTSALILIPSRAFLSPLNTNSNGISIFVESYSPNILIEPISINELCKSVVFIPVARPLTLEEIKLIKNSARCNSTIVILDSTGSVPTALGMDIVVGAKVIDEINDYGDRFTPKIYVFNNLDKQKKIEIAIREPRALLVGGIKTFEILFKSSNFSYIDINGNGFYDYGEPIGSTIVGIGMRYGNGTIIYIASSSLIMNSIINYNTMFLNNLTRDRNVFIYLGAIPIDSFEKIRIALYSYSIGYPDRNRLSIAIYILSTLFSVIATKIYGYRKLVRRSKNIILLAIPYIALMLVFISMGFHILGIMAMLTSILILIPTIRFLAPISAVAIAVSSTVYRQLVYFSIVLGIFAIPISMVIEMKNVSRFIGGITRLTILTFLATAPLLFLNPYILIPISAGMIFILIVMISIWITLGKVSIDIVETDTSIPLGGMWKIGLTITNRNPFKINTILIYDSIERSISVDTISIAEIEGKADSTGIKRVDIDVYVCDDFGIASRFIGRIGIDIRVIPGLEIKRRIEDIKKVYGANLSKRDLAMVKLTVVDMARKRGIEKEVMGIYEIERAIELFTHRFMETAYINVGEELIREIIYMVYQHYKRWIYGEYRGTRRYVSGDSLRHIHWKKTASRGELMVKEFDVPLEGYPQLYTQQVALNPILLIVLDTIDISEFEYIAINVLNMLIEFIERGWRDISLVILGSNTILVLGGATETILTLFIDALERFLPRLRYKHWLINKRINDKNLEYIVASDKLPKPFLVVREYSRKIAIDIVYSLRRNSILPPRAIIPIYPQSSALRTGIILKYLESFGYPQVKRI